MSGSKFTPNVLAAIAATILFWSSAYVGTRIAIRYYDIYALALFRYLAASGVLAVYAVTARIRMPRRQDIFPLFLTGFLGIAVYVWLFNAGHKTVTAATGAFLISATPLFTAFFSSIFLRERLNTRGWLGLVISLAGAGVIALAESPVRGWNTGVFLILIAAALLAAYNIMVKRFSRHYQPLEITTFTFWSGTICMLGAFPSLLRELPQAPWSADAVVIFLGIFPAALGYMLWAYALARAQASRVASFMYLTPLLTMALGWIWIREFPSPLTVAGGLIVLAGVILTNTRRK